MDKVLCVILPKVCLCLPGERQWTSHTLVITEHDENTLGYNIFKGEVWQLPDGNIWSLKPTETPSKFSEENERINSTSNGFKHVLTGVEVVFELLAVTKSRYTDAKATISGFYNCFSGFPVPDYTQSDNGTPLTSVMAQHWDRKEGIKGIFHITMKLLTLLSPSKQDGGMC